MKCLSCALLAAVIALGQGVAPKFEVVSVTAAKVGDRHPNGISGNRFALGPMPLVGLIQYAYNLPLYQIAGAPALTEQNYVVDAKAPGEGALAMESARTMLQVALEDRFALRVHRGVQMMPVYEMTVAEGGTKLKRSTAQASGLQLQFTRIVSAKTSMDSLARMLSTITGRPVLDKTGLDGDYEIDLKFAPAIELPQGAPEAQVEGPSVFTAMREQLGLMLEAKKDPMEILVVDHWEKPSEN